MSRRSTSASPRPTWLAVLAVLAAVGLAGAGCAGDPEPTPGEEPSGQGSGPRPVTADEADRLAIARFRNYEREVVAFQMTVPVDAGVATLEGRADMREHRAVAAATLTRTTGEAPTYAMFAWNLVAATYTTSNVPVGGEQVAAAARIPAEDWEPPHPLEGSQEPLDQVSLVLLNLALDRPDNALLLRQNGAQWRGSTVVDGVEVDVMTATPLEQGGTLTYYVTDDGTLARVDVALGAQQPGSITFLDEDPAAVGDVPVVEALGPTPDTEPGANPG